MTKKAPSKGKPPQAASHASSRAAAVRIVLSWLRTGRFPAPLLDNVHEDRAVVAEMVYGCIRWKGLFEWMIGRLARTRPSREVRAYLWVGLHQIFFMDGVPAYAAVAETVQAARKGPARRAAGFINAVLRRAAGEMDALRADAGRQPLHVRESHPDILVKRWERHFGPEAAEALCRWNNTPPTLALTVDTARTSLEAFRAGLTAHGVEAHAHPSSPDLFVEVPAVTNVRALPGYDEGLFTVRDPATQKAVDLLDVRPGMRVLDACAAPGGKTVAVAQRLADRGDVLAVEPSGVRRRRLEANCRRAGLTCVHIAEGSADTPEALREVAGHARFDRVLVDAPCTNTGVLRRRVDARWRFSANALGEAVALQRRLLETCLAATAPNGILVYSTCSLEPEENAGVVEYVLAKHTDMAMEESLQTFPPTSGTDGMYAAAIRRLT